VFAIVPAKKWVRHRGYRDRMDAQEMAEADEIDEFGNVYLIAGVRGDFRLHSATVPVGVEAAILHTLERWGISPPWGPCDSGADLSTHGDHILRGWSHVDLGSAEQRTDVPLTALLRTTCDGLELYGSIKLSGVDADVPTWRAAESLSQRLWLEVRDASRAPAKPPRVLVQAGTGRGSDPITWDATGILETLSKFVPVHRAMDGVAPASYTGSGESPFVPSGDDTFRAEVTLPNWTIDDASWLAEVMASSCYRAGIKRSVMIAVRLLDETGGCWSEPAHDASNATYEISSV
jgi:hypothetical protein